MKVMMVMANKNMSRKSTLLVHIILILEFWQKLKLVSSRIPDLRWSRKLQNKGKNLDKTISVTSRRMPLSNFHQIWDQILKTLCTWLRREYLKLVCKLLHKWNASKHRPTLEDLLTRVSSMILTISLDQQAKELTLSLQKQNLLPTLKWMKSLISSLTVLHSELKRLFNPTKLSTSSRMILKF